MRNNKREKLERAGWEVTDTQEFLGLSDTEMALIDIRVAFAKALRERRKERKISQERFAQNIGSSQSRVAKMEAGDPSVSIELLLKALLRTGSTKRQIANLIAA